MMRTQTFKANLMKIAIPTDDGIHINPEMSAKGFTVFTVELGEITGEEIRWNKVIDGTSMENGLLNAINDCPVILVKSINVDETGTLNGKQIIPVKGTIITKVIWNYIAEITRKEANYCCCP